MKFRKKEEFPKPLSGITKKKKRNLELSAEEEEEEEHNKSHSIKRIMIEHTICRLKKFRILAEVFRNKLRKYNKVSDIVAGLINYRTLNYQN